MNEAGWDQARLIPTSGIDDVEEQERRATSALLAVIGGIDEFGRAVVQPLAAPAGEIEAFIDVSFSLGERTCFPAGLIRIQHGPLTWIALVEVRTGENGLDAERLDAVLAVAQEQGFDAVLTISNENPGPDGRPPVAVGSERRDGLHLHHISWSRLLADAVTLADLRAVADPEQVWVLAELIRYLEDPRAGAIWAEVPAQIVRGVQMPEPREPVLDLDLREPHSTVLHTVMITEPVTRVAPSLPSRRELRLVRRLGVEDEAGWYQDPHDGGQLRWWDGAGWSERTYPGQPALA